MKTYNWLHRGEQESFAEIEKLAATNPTIVPLWKLIEAGLEKFTNTADLFEYIVEQGVGEKPELVAAMDVCAETMKREKEWVEKIKWLIFDIDKQLKVAEKVDGQKVVWVNELITDPTIVAALMDYYEMIFPAGVSINPNHDVGTTTIAFDYEGE